MRKILLLLFFIPVLNISAQDLHFSQFLMSPLTLNPALTGMFNGNYRVIINYRNRWQNILPGVPFKTFGGSAEVSFPSGANNRFGAGINYFSTKADSFDINKTQVSVSLAYLFCLSKEKNYFIAAGLQESYNNISFNYARITTGNQWDGTGFNSFFSPVAASFSGLSKTYYDRSAGVILYHINNPREYQYAGLSYYHINEPNISFIANSLDRLYSKYTLHAGAGLKLERRFDINPYVIGMVQGPDFEMTGGALLRFIWNEEKNHNSLSVGPFLWIMGNNYNAAVYDAVIIAAKLEVWRMILGLSYDLSIAGLNPAVARKGAPEISVQYIGAFSKKPGGNFFPRF